MSIIEARTVPVPAVKRPPMWLVAYLWDHKRRPGGKIIDWAVENFASEAEAVAVADAQTNGGVVFYLPGSGEAQ